MILQAWLQLDAQVFLHKCEALALETWGAAQSVHLSLGHPPTSYPPGGMCNLSTQLSPKGTRPREVCLSQRWDPGQLGQPGCSHHWLGLAGFGAYSSQLPGRRETQVCPEGRLGPAWRPLLKAFLQCSARLGGTPIYSLAKLWPGLTGWASSQLQSMLCQWGMKTPWAKGQTVLWDFSGSGEPSQ